MSNTKLIEVTYKGNTVKELDEDFIVDEIADLEEAKNKIQKQIDNTQIETLKKAYSAQINNINEAIDALVAELASREA